MIFFMISVVPPKALTKRDSHLPVTSRYFGVDPSPQPNK